jgi:hypothetical protein
LQTNLLNLNISGNKIKLFLQIPAAKDLLTTGSWEIFPGTVGWEDFIEL